MDPSGLPNELCSIFQLFGIGASDKKHVKSDKLRNVMPFIGEEFCWRN